MSHFWKFSKNNVPGHYSNNYGRMRVLQMIIFHIRSYNCIKLQHSQVDGVAYVRVPISKVLKVEKQAEKTWEKVDCLFMT